MLGALLKGAVEGADENRKIVRLQEQRQNKLLLDRQKLEEQRQYDRQLQEEKRNYDYQQKKFSLTDEGKKVLNNAQVRSKSFATGRKFLAEATATGAIRDPTKLSFMGTLNKITPDVLDSTRRVEARKNLDNYVNGDLIPLIVESEGLPLTDSAVKLISKKYNLKNLSPNQIGELIDRIEEIDNLKVQTYKNQLDQLDPAERQEMISTDPAFDGLRKQITTEKVDREIAQLSPAAVSQELLKMGVQPQDLAKMPQEIQKNVARELSISLISSTTGALSGAAAGAALGSVVPIIGNIAGGVIGAVLGGLGGDFAAHAAERTLSGDPNALSNAFTDLKEDLPSEVAFSLGVPVAGKAAKALGAGKLLKGGYNLVKEGIEGITGLGAKKAERSAENLVRSSYDIAKETIEPISSGVFKETLKTAYTGAAVNERRAVDKILANELKDGSYDADYVERVITRFKKEADTLAKQNNTTTDVVKQLADTIENTFAPARAAVSTAQGKLLGAQRAIDNGDIHDVLRFFKEMPNELKTVNGKIPKSEILKRFVVENSDKWSPQRSAAEVEKNSNIISSLANGTLGWLGKLPKALVNIAIDSTRNKDLAKLLSEAVNSGGNGAVEKELLEALKGKIVESAAPEVISTLQKTLWGVGKEAIAQVPKNIDRSNRAADRGAF